MCVCVCVCVYHLCDGYAAVVEALHLVQVAQAEVARAAALVLVADELQDVSVDGGVALRRVVVQRSAHHADNATHIVAVHQVTRQLKGFIRSCYHSNNNFAITMQGLSSHLVCVVNQAAELHDGVRDHHLQLQRQQSSYIRIIGVVYRHLSVQKIRSKTYIVILVSLLAHSNTNKVHRYCKYMCCHVCATMTDLGDCQKVSKSAIMADEHEILLVGRLQRSIRPAIFPVGPEEVVPHGHEETEVVVVVSMVTQMKLRSVK